MSVYMVKAKPNEEEKDGVVTYKLDHPSLSKNSNKQIELKASNNTELYSNIDIQHLYTNLYRCMRSYIWDVPTVKELFNLEEEVYQAFPDVSKIKIIIGHLKSMVNSTIKRYDDDQFERCINAFDNITEDTYVPLTIIGGSTDENYTFL